MCPSEHDKLAEAREALWLGHGHHGPALYGDDGEMQCHACRPHMDYRRAPLVDCIKAALAAARAEGAAEAFEKAAGLARERQDHFFTRDHAASFVAILHALAEKERGA